MNRTYWIVYVGKKEYRITESQYEFMQRENMKNGTQTFWFEGFTISLPHVSSMDKVTEVTKAIPKLPDLTPMETEKAKKKLDEIRERFHPKMKQKKQMSTAEGEERRELLKNQARQLKNG